MAIAVAMATADGTSEGSVGGDEDFLVGRHCVLVGNHRGDPAGNHVRFRSVETRLGR